MLVLCGETLGTFEHNEAGGDFKGAWIFNPVKPGKDFKRWPLDNEIPGSEWVIEGGNELEGGEEAERAIDSRRAAIVGVNVRKWGCL